MTICCSWRVLLSGGCSLLESEFNLLLTIVTQRPFSSCRNSPDMVNGTVAVDLSAVFGLDPPNRIASEWGGMAEAKHHAGKDQQVGGPSLSRRLTAIERRRTFSLAVRLTVPALAVPLLLPACVPPDPPGAGAAAVPAPRYATYRCDGDGEIMLEDFRTSVHVVDAKDVDVELPAAPPDQTTRYGQPGYALILEKGTALWMVTGKRPVNCRRESDPA
jgi:hypothetical protein